MRSDNLCARRNWSFTFAKVHVCVYRV
jgi:hypothetical protein